MIWLALWAALAGFNTGIDAMGWIQRKIDGDKPLGPLVTIMNMLTGPVSVILAVVAIVHGATP